MTSLDTHISTSAEVTVNKFGQQDSPIVQGEHFSQGSDDIITQWSRGQLHFWGNYGYQQIQNFKESTDLNNKSDNFPFDIPTF